jgi:hypothetical protein
MRYIDNSPLDRHGVLQRESQVSFRYQPFRRVNLCPTICSVCFLSNFITPPRRASSLGQKLAFSQFLVNIQISLHLVSQQRTLVSLTMPAIRTSKSNGSNKAVQQSLNAFFKPIPNIKASAKALDGSSSIIAITSVSKHPLPKPARPQKKDAHKGKKIALFHYVKDWVGKYHKVIGTSTTEIRLKSLQALRTLQQFKRHRGRELVFQNQ